jgi:hypothetical protein
MLDLGQLLVSSSMGADGRKSQKDKNKRQSEKSTSIIPIVSFLNNRR